MNLTDKTTRTTGACVMAIVMAAAAAGVTAQQAAPSPGFTRTVLQQSDISAPGREAVMALIEMQPGASPGRHTHPGEEIGYVLQGSVKLEQDGKPAVTLDAGKPFVIPAGVVHNATAAGPGMTKILSTYVVEKGKPLVTPAAALAR